MSTSVSSVTSHFPSPQDGFTTTTSGPVASGASTVGLNSVAGYLNGQVFTGVIDPSDTTKKQAFTGIVDTGGSQITNVVWTSGTNTTHSAGATVVDYATATHIAQMTKGILVQHKQDGTHANTITTDTINENTTANGITVDGLNIKDSKLNTNNSVVTNNITADAVTDAKLVYGKLRQRQGGSATDWSSTGTNNYDYSGTDVFIQAGSIAVGANPTTVTFPVAFNQVPIVMATMASAASANAFVICTARTTTTASFRCVNDAGTVVTTESINWIAIGE